MFLHMSVILFTGGRGVLSQHALQVVSQHALQQGGGCSRGVCSRGVCSQGECLLQGVPAQGWGLLRGGVETPPFQKQTATVADGTHPTGMHSCIETCLLYDMF